MYKRPCHLLDIVSFQTAGDAKQCQRQFPAAHSRVEQSLLIDLLRGQAGGTSFPRV